MANVNIKFNNKEYVLSCEDGQEDHLKELANHLNVKFDNELDISYNTRYLIDIASQLDGDKIEIFLNDTGSAALIKDPSDFDSIYVVMPMKG